MSVYAAQSRMIPEVFFADPEQFVRTDPETARNVLQHMCERFCGASEAWILSVERWDAVAPALLIEFPRPQRLASPAAQFVLAMHAAEPLYYCWERSGLHDNVSFLGGWREQSHLNYGSYADQGRDSFLAAVTGLHAKHT